MPNGSRIENLCHITPKAQSLLVLIFDFSVMIKDSYFFSRVIVVHDFETVTFYVLFVYKPTFSVIFC